MVNTKFWDDDWVVHLDPLEKLLFLYLITNPETSLTGCYQVSLRRVAFDTGIDESAVKNILKRFIVDKKVYYVDGWMIIANHDFHNPFRGNDLERAKSKEVDSFPKRVLTLWQQGDNTSNNNISSNSNNNNNNKSTEVVKKVAYGNSDVNKVLNYFDKLFATKIINQVKQRNFATNLIKQHGVAKMLSAIDVARAAADDKYGPNIGNVTDLYYKWGQLQNWANKHMKKPPNMVKIS